MIPAIILTQKIWFHLCELSFDKTSREHHANYIEVRHVNFLLKDCFLGSLQWIRFFKKWVANNTSILILSSDSQYLNSWYLLLCSWKRHYFIYMSYHLTRNLENTMLVYWAKTCERPTEGPFSRKFVMNLVSQKVVSKQQQ